MLDETGWLTQLILSSASTIPLTMQFAKLKPSELRKAPHAARELAQKDDGAVVEPVPYPSSKPSFGFGNVLAADSRIGSPNDKLDSPEDNPEGPFYPVRLYHFVCLPRIRSV